MVWLKRGNINLVSLVVDSQVGHKVPVCFFYIPGFQRRWCNSPVSRKTCKATIARSCALLLPSYIWLPSHRSIKAALQQHYNIFCMLWWSKTRLATEVVIRTESFFFNGITLKIVELESLSLSFPISFEIATSFLNCTKQVVNSNITTCFDRKIKSTNQFYLQQLLQKNATIYSNYLPYMPC